MIKLITKSSANRLYEVLYVVDIKVTFVLITCRLNDTTGEINKYNIKRAKENTWTFSEDEIQRESEQMIWRWQSTLKRDEKIAFKNFDVEHLFH